MKGLLDSTYGEDKAVLVATIHRVKGLEFDEIILASMNEGLVPFESILKDKGDAVEHRQADLEERALGYVAVARAKKVALMLSYENANPYYNTITNCRV